MTKRFDELEAKLDTKADRAQVERLQASADHFAGRLDTEGTEQAARDTRFERLLAWARKVSAKTGIPLEDL